MYEKLTKSRIFMIFTPKINQISEFYMTFARKMPEFNMIIARKIFFPDFLGAGVVRALHCPSPVSYRHAAGPETPLETAQKARRKM